MKVLMFDFGETFPPHLATEAELAQRHLNQGDTVLRFVCQADMPICRGNPDHSLMMCALCLSRRASAMNMVQPRVPERSVIDLTPEDRRTIAAFRWEAKNLAELKKVHFGPFDVGLAAAAPIVDHTKDPDPDFSVHGQMVRDWVGVSVAVYVSTLNILAKEKPDRVYVMNGRWGYTRAVLRACQQKGVDCICHEMGGDAGRILLVANRLPHDIAGHTRDVEELWLTAEPAERAQVGATYFEEKAKGIERNWYSFVADQHHGRLPADWTDARHNVAVFMSSEFEFAAVGPEWDHPFYLNQNDGVRRILAALESGNAPIHLNIRVHPNMKGIMNQNLDELLAIRSPKATIIPPESPISSYDLMWACEKTLTFGSTMGIEAVYWQKPSILAGPSLYQHLDGTYNASNHQQVIELLLAPLAAKSREAALKYGYHELRKGLERAYYKAETPFTGKYKGNDFDQVIPLSWRIVMRVARSRFYRVLEWFSPRQRQKVRQRIGMPRQTANGKASH
jgi:hypothetical protein